MYISNNFGVKWKQLLGMGDYSRNKIPPPLDFLKKDNNKKCLPCLIIIVNLTIEQSNLSHTRCGVPTGDPSGGGLGTSQFDVIRV